MIDPKSIEKLKNQIDIVNIIEQYIPVKKMGSSYKCVCPFHDDKNPSMSINQNKQMYHCFACKAGGDAVKFVMDYEKLTYPEAIEKIAQISNFSLEYTNDKVPTQKENKHILEKVNAFYRSEFYKNEAAVRYIKSRGINDAMIEKFELGWAGDSKSTIRLLQNENIEPKEALEVGIVKQNEKGIYASFIERVTFPIYSHTTRLVGFGGRTISDHPAKYVNSPQSGVFDKSKLLYGYHLARQSIFEKKQIIITEGYLDVIMLHYAGFTNAVAVLGTALTTSHLPLLKRDNISVILCFDGDGAGINAAIKSAHLLSINKIDTKVVIINNGADPADMVFAGKIKELNELFGSGEDAVKFYIEKIMQKYDITRSMQRDNCLSEIKAYMDELGEEIASSYVTEVAARFNLTPQSVADRFGLKQKPKNEAKFKREFRKKDKDEFSNSVMVDEVPAVMNKDPLEFALFKTMLNNPNYRDEILSKLGARYFIKHPEYLNAILYRYDVSDEEMVREILMDENIHEITDATTLQKAILNMQIAFYENEQQILKGSDNPNKIEILEKLLFIIKDLKTQLYKI